MTTETEVPVTPTDEAQPKKKRKYTKRGQRKRVLGEGEGDYCIYEIMGEGSDLPTGSLVPIPNVPRFADSVSAIKWIKTESTDVLSGKQIMVFRAMEIMTLQVMTKPTVVIQSKPKIAVTPAPETA